MPHKLRRIRKTRGSRTQGYGRVGQHRDTGSKGYRKCGRHKAKWSYVIRYEPNHFGKNGFTSPKNIRQTKNPINVGKLDETAQELTTQSEKGKYIDLEKLGYTKLLGSGQVNQPLVVKVAACSPSAAEKIKNAGGQVLAKNEEE